MASRIGDYRIEREVRWDASGVVYEAVHAVLPRRAAIKIHAGGRGDAVLMLREACVLEALSHPGIPRVYECGVLPDRRPWIAHEWLDGESLADAAPPLHPREVIALVRSIADVLAHAHARGIVHHKLCAEAVLRTPDRMFPIAVQWWDDAVAHDSAVPADPSIDIHALGGIAKRLLGETEAAPELSHLIDQMLVPEPRWRPSASDLRDRVGEQLLVTPEPRVKTGDIKVRFRG